MAKVPGRTTATSLRGRRIGIATFTLIVTVFTAVCSVQIILQAWAVTPAPAGTDCRSALRGLVRAVHRATRSAGEAAHLGERAALARFRASLDPEWGLRSALAERCRGDAAAVRGLGDVDRFRYASERASRYDVIEVANLRRLVESWDENKTPRDP